MKPVLSLALVVCLVGLVVPVATEGLPHSAKETSDWSRVRGIRPGTEIIVTAQGRAAVHRYALTSDDASLTVLNLSNATLPATARRGLREVAGTHPEYFAAAQTARFVLPTQLTMRPEGVFEGGQKVADLEQIVEQLRREDLVLIRDPHPRRPRRGTALTLAGMAAGMAAGLLGTYVVCSDCNPVTATFLLGLGGGVAGAVRGSRLDRAAADDVIYRGPETSVPDGDLRP